MTTTCSLNYQLHIDEKNFIIAFLHNNNINGIVCSWDKTIAVDDNIFEVFKKVFENSFKLSMLHNGRFFFVLSGVMLGWCFIVRERNI